MTELHDLSLRKAAEALRSGQISSRELTQASLDRIEQLEPTLRAFITLTPDLALAQADAADQLLQAWRKNPLTDLHPLLGLPMAVKDLLAQANVRCTCGSHVLENFIPLTARPAWIACSRQASSQ